MHNRMTVYLLAIVGLGAVIPFPRATVAQSATLDELLAQTAAHIRSYVPHLANVVCEEEYVQQGRSPTRERRLRSDFLLVHYPPGGIDQWMVFRDVLEVDGEPLADQQQRVIDLFIEPAGDAVARATRIVVEGLRHHLWGFSRVVVNPLSIIVFLQDDYRPALRFTRGNEDPSVGPGVRIVRFEEPDLRAYRNVLPENRPPRLFGEQGGRGSVWIEERTGRVLKADLRLPGLGGATSTTTFRFDEQLALDVPAEMHTTWPDGRAGNQVTGVATYTRCRRFDVQAETTLELSPP